MSAIPAPRVLPPKPGEIFYPCSDDQPLAETGVHFEVIYYLVQSLRDRYSHRPDHYVASDMFLYWEEGNPEARRAPDVMVVKGVEPKPPRPNFKIWEEGATPAVIFEVTSPSTATEDVTGKFQIYERIGVKEYFLFDPLHEYLAGPLMGYRLIGNKYEQLMPSADGCLISNELQLQLCPEGNQLILFDFRTGKRLPTAPEMRQLRQEAEQRQQQDKRSAQEAERQRQQEQQRADEAEREKAVQSQRADEAERRLVELTAELARLRAAAPPTNGANPLG